MNDLKVKTVVVELLTGQHSRMGLIEPALGWWKGGWSGTSYHLELFKTRTGCYVLSGSGGADSPCSCTAQVNPPARRPGGRTIEVSGEDAIALLAIHDGHTHEPIIAMFGKINDARAEWNQQKSYEKMMRDYARQQQ